MSRCRACNKVVDKVVLDTTGEDSGLCHECYGVSEAVRLDEYTEPVEYLHLGSKGHSPD